jgi:hypothetical protein
VKLLGCSTLVLNLLGAFEEGGILDRVILQSAPRETECCAIVNPILLIQNYISKGISEVDKLFVELKDRCSFLIRRQTFNDILSLVEVLKGDSCNLELKVWRRTTRKSSGQTPRR